MQRDMFLRVERRARRMHELMERLRVNPGVLARMEGGEAYAKARARCFFCGTSDKCLRWLDQPAGRHGRPEFCPNLSLFEAARPKEVAVAVPQARNS